MAGSCRGRVDSGHGFSVMSSWSHLSSLLRPASSGTQGGFFRFFVSGLGGRRKVLIMQRSEWGRRRTIKQSRKTLIIPLPYTNTVTPLTPHSPSLTMSHKSLLGSLNRCLPVIQDPSSSEPEDHDGLPRVAGSIPLGRRASIGVLSDDVLLVVFGFCRMSSSWHWHWPRLVHVCQRWRLIVFASPRSLDLWLYCTPRTLVKNTCCWPAFPIAIRSIFLLRTKTTLLRHCSMVTTGFAASSYV
ncbi:hypothetical protein EDB86DRAFT_2927076 [Lactarius hatsudake]|nr:hypothetical protein EDB86DRAFT_2927076 [Lactarius hatsudake]